MSLQAFIDQENRMATFMGLPQIDPNNIDDAKAQEMFQRLDSNLSPEALYQDGERPRAQAAKLAKLYKAAITELKAKGFTPKREMYNV